MRDDDAWEGFTSRMGSVRVDMRATIRTVRATIAFAVAGLLMCAWPSPGYGRVYSIKHPSLVLNGNQRPVNVLAFSADGRQIALAGDRGEVEIWDVRASHRLRTLKGSSQVFAVAFSPSGRQLATSSADSKINVWQLQGDDLPSSFEVPGGPVYSIGYTPDGNQIAAGCKDGVIRLYSTGGQLIHAFGDIVSGISVIDSPAGVRIAGLEGQGVRMWDAQTGEPVLAWPLDMLPWLPPHVQHMGLTKIPSFQLSPAADFVAVAGEPMPGSSPPGIYLMTVWNTVTGKTAPEMGGVGFPIYVFSARGRIAVSSFAGISVIDLKSGRELHRYGIVQPSVRSLMFSPDENWIASGHDDGVVRIWEIDRSRDIELRQPKRERRHPPVADRVRGGGPDEPEQITR